ncbi:hypothetical protein AB0K27_11675 [Micromonospora echinospora]|uniref:Uncharacterized protein n=1 Tax=Micromonospora echinospora TaxID=1877 RepID=A0ABR6MLX4_MICEC|nr:hypothetical protein [Micromonospora echinospora]MBB5116104.1 hypothetical protein [Micromonospora echinospora]
MPEPLDLTETLGEGWCITVAPLAAEESLRNMGVAQPADVSGARRLVVERLSTRRPGDRSVLLLGKQVTPHRAIVLELEGTTGWVGLDPAVLSGLSTGGVACSVMSDPNRIAATFAADGQVNATLDLITGRAWGTPPAPVVAVFGDGGPRSRTDLTFSQRAAVVLEAMTGATIDAAVVLDDPWQGGLTGGA